MSVLQLRYCDMLDRRAVRQDMRVPIVCGVIALLVASIVVLNPMSTAMRLLGWGEEVRAISAPVPQAQLRQIAAMTVDNKAQIIAEGVTARDRNAALPVSFMPVEQPRSFIAQAAGKSSYDTAVKCLAQAVYYEASVEPLQGRRAVAQVVLNRVRHPAYPRSVCGVVYQGSERWTGCQFSFTCDGSLLRTPMAKPWREAQDVARAALAGYVEKSVGTATHYHADYVLPKWAFQLAKIEQLGRHIFYRFNGSWGRTAALSGRYSGFEYIPAINLLALRKRLDAEESSRQLRFETGLTIAPHVTDRHAANDVGGRLDATKEWRLSIPDPVSASSGYRESIGAQSVAEAPQTHNAEREQPKIPTP